MELEQLALDMLEGDALASFNAARANAIMVREGRYKDAESDYKRLTAEANAAYDRTIRRAALSALRTMIEQEEAKENATQANS